jgi:hypothetical protein
MIREIIKKKQKGDLCEVIKMYQCKVCGKVYRTFDDAKRCELCVRDPLMPNSEPIDTRARPYFLPTTPADTEIGDRRLE